MPLKGTAPVCLKCETTESSIWTNAENLGAICLDCVNEAKDNLKTEQDEENDDKSEESRGIKRKQRHTRSYKTRLNPLALPNKSVVPKGRGRRAIFKKTPIKAPTAVATPITSEFIFYKGSYIQVGDIVSMQDENDDIYYAQIKGLLTDQYCEKSAVITWLLPTQESPPPNEGFDPATYIIGSPPRASFMFSCDQGPEEDVPRKLECMEFVMHAPSDYYRSKTSPYPLVHAPAKPGYIWTTLESIRQFCVPPKN